MTGIPDDFDEFKRKKFSEHAILDSFTKQKEITNIVREIEKTQDFDRLEQIGIRLNKKLYGFKAKAIQTPRIALG